MAKLTIKNVSVTLVVGVLIILNVYNNFYDFTAVESTEVGDIKQGSLQYNEMTEIFSLGNDDYEVKRDIFAIKKPVKQVVIAEKKKITKVRKAPSQREVFVKGIKLEIKKFKLAGIARKKGILYAFILFDDDTHEAKVGDVLYKKYKVKEITEKELLLVHVSGDVKEKIQLGK